VRLVIRAVLVLWGAAVTGIVVFVLGYVGFWMFDRCVNQGGRVCEPWPGLAFGAFMSLVAIPVGAALTYRWTRPRTSQIAKQDAEQAG
jgi:hypothetical protein